MCVHACTYMYVCEEGQYCYYIRCMLHLIHHFTGRDTGCFGQGLRSDSSNSDIIRKWCNMCIYVCVLFRVQKYVKGTRGNQLICKVFISPSPPNLNPLGVPCKHLEYKYTCSVLLEYGFVQDTYFFLTLILQVQVLRVGPIFENSL